MDHQEYLQRYSCVRARISGRQPRGRARSYGGNTTALAGHIRPFAQIWHRNRVTGFTNPFPSMPTADFDRVTADMTTRFLQWLDALGRGAGAF